MGVTIHFEGALRDEAAYLELVRLVRGAGESHGWPSAPIEESNATLRRVRNEEPWDYTGPTRGIALAPHENCEPLRFEFDRDLFIQEYVKTQFAGSTVHVAVVELLRCVAPFFRELLVIDEGEYWETSERSVLEAHLFKTDQIIAQQIAADATLTGPIRLPSGRITDLIRGERTPSALPRSRWHLWKRR